MGKVMKSFKSVWRDTSYDSSGDTKKVTEKELQFGADSSPPLSQSLPGYLPNIAESPIYGQLTPREVRVSFKEALSETVVKRVFNPSDGTAAGSGCSSATE